MTELVEVLEDTISNCVPAEDERPSFRLRVAGAIALAVVLAVSFVFPPSGLGISVCAFKNAFGIPCPGCGLSRSFAALSHGQVWMAFSVHPLGPIIYAAFAFYMVKWIIEVVLRRRLLARTEDRLRIPVLWGLLLSMLCVWAIRLAAGTAV